MWRVTQTGSPGPHRRTRLQRQWPREIDRWDEETARCPIGEAKRRLRCKQGRAHSARTWILPPSRRNDVSPLLHDFADRGQQLFARERLRQDFPHMQTLRRLAGTTETSPETGRQREDGRRIRVPQCLNRSASAARFGNVRNHEPGYDRGFVMVFRGQHDAVPGFAEPAPEEFANQVVGFDNDDVAAHAHEVPWGMRTLASPAKNSCPTAIRSAWLYGNMPVASV